MLCLFLAACQSTLTEFEQSAAANRPLATEEQVTRSKLCTPMVVQQLRGSPPAAPAGTIGRLVELRPAQALSILRLVKKTSETYDIQKYHDLPNGGIFSIHLCGSVLLHPATLPGAPGETLSEITLLLPPNFDVTAAYPNTGAEILRRGQLRHIPGGTYLELRSSGKPTIADRILKERPTFPQQDPARDILGIGDLIYIPLVD